METLFMSVGAVLGGLFVAVYGFVNLMSRLQAR